MLNPDERKFDDNAFSASIFLYSQEFKLNITRSQPVGRKLLGLRKQAKHDESVGLVPQQLTNATQLATLQRLIHALNTFYSIIL